MGMGTDMDTDGGDPKDTLDTPDTSNGNGESKGTGTGNGTKRVLVVLSTNTLEHQVAKALADSKYSVQTPGVMLDECKAGAQVLIDLAPIRGLISRHPLRELQGLTIETNREVLNSRVSEFFALDPEILTSTIGYWDAGPNQLIPVICDLPGCKHLPSDHDTKTIVIESFSAMFEASSHYRQGKSKSHGLNAQGNTKHKAKPSRLPDFVKDKTKHGRFKKY